MNVSGFLQKPAQPYASPPPCFGRDWDKNEAECAGGPDASFVPKTGEAHNGIDPQSGAHVRKQCVWFQSCGARCAAAKNANGTLTPPQQQVAQAAPQPAQPQTFGQWIANAQAQHVKTQQQAAFQQVRPPVPVQAQMPAQQQQYYQQQVYAGGHVQPSTAWHLNYQMPGYLSEPEIRHPGESIWAVLLREILRSMGKAIGHSVSHFFDARVLK